MSYHFIGIGGIGMSALARILLQRGEKVQGSDLHESALVQALRKEGAHIHIGHSSEHLKMAETVIFSTDIREDNAEFQKAKEKNLPLFHRSDFLHELMKGKKVCLVAGSHGKTTTTALLSAVLMEAKFDPSFVIGGILSSLNSNGREGKGGYFVAEADESDGSFLKTAADFAILTNIGNDHLSYWGSEKVHDLAFEQFIAQTKSLFWCADDPKLSKIRPKGISYGFSEGADYRIKEFRQDGSGIVFDLGKFKEIRLNLLGRHNALNGAAVFALAILEQVPEEAIRQAFQRFSGTERRLEFKGEVGKVSLYDDYGHHPSEIKATLKALRGAIFERRLVALFQPHRYTRVRDLWNQFQDCLNEADLIFMTDIYSAGEKSLPEVTSLSFYSFLKEKLGEKIQFLPRNELEEGVANALRPLDVVLTLGAGDITKAGKPILEKFGKRKAKLKIALLFGGSSAEHPVSVMSAKNIFKALNPEVYEVGVFGVTQEGHFGLGFDFEGVSKESKIPLNILEKLSGSDCVIPVFHGPKGEDGMMAAFLEMMGIPYVGCGPLSGAIAMQKSWAKYVALGVGIKTSPFLEFDFQSKEEIVRQVEEKIPYPVWVKPVHLGSSIGVSRAAETQELIQAIELARKFDEVILVEEELVGRQIEFSVLGNEWVRFALPAEIVSHGEFVAYDKKYGRGAMEIQVPANITETEKKIGYELAEKIYRACNCKGLARIDFFLDERGVFWFNEINPFPGCTDTSAYPKAWATSGVSSEKMVDEWISLAFHRARKRI